MPKHDKFITEACIEALKSNMQSKHGCIIKYRNKIVGRGHNKMLLKYGDFQSKTKNIRSVHAEIDAMSNTDKKYMKNCIIYVVRIKSACTLEQILEDELHLCNSAPCKYCSRVIGQRCNSYNIVYS